MKKREGEREGGREREGGGIERERKTQKLYFPKIKKFFSISQFTSAFSVFSNIRNYNFGPF